MYAHVQIHVYAYAVHKHIVATSNMLVNFADFAISHNKQYIRTHMYISMETIYPNTFGLPHLPQMILLANDLFAQIGVSANVDNDICQMHVSRTIACAPNSPICLQSPLIYCKSRIMLSVSIYIHTAPLDILQISCYVAYLEAAGRPWSHTQW